MKRKSITFNLPQGQIGNSGIYRINDGCYTGKDGWDLYVKMLMEEGKKYMEPLPPKRKNIKPINKRYHK